MLVGVNFQWQKMRYSVLVKQALRYTIFLIPLWWFLGVNFIIFHLITSLLLLALLITRKNEEKLLIPIESLPLLMFILTYVFSVVINLQNIPFVRLLATLYNLSFWIIGLILIVVIYNINLRETNIIGIAKSFTVFGIICGLLATGGIVLWLSGHRGLTVYSFPYRFIPIHLINNAPLLNKTLICTIIGSGWTGFGLLPRGSLFFVYATALGMGMVITIPMTIYYFRTKSKLSKAFMPVVLQSIALIFSLSRIVIVGLLSFILVYFVLYRRKSSFFLAIHLGMLFVILILFFVPALPKKTLNATEAFRKGSTTTRLSLYRDTIERTLKKPVLGYGFKPRETGMMGIPIGSHSTFVGSLYKTGIVGFIFLLMFWVMVYRTWRKQLRKISDKSLRCLWYCLGVAFLGGIIWQFTEDLDAPPIVAFFYFLIVAFIVSFRKINVRTLSVKE